MVDITDELEYLSEDQCVGIESVVSVLTSDFDREVQSISIVLVSDGDMLDMNVQHLGHDYYTDILTFDLSLDGEDSPLVAELYISYDRVVDNAVEFGVTTDFELYRVVAHGLLHLYGHDDGTPEERQLMREREDYYLSKIVPRGTI